MTNPLTAPMPRYTVRLINLGMDKGSFLTLCEAVSFAHRLGFECTIVRDGEFIRSVKPY